MASPETQQEQFAFVLIPFEEKFDLIYKYLIIPSLESAGYKVKRADSLLDQQNIMKDIIVNIDSASLIVAEITSLNPNVMYELGIAHALLKPTILLTQSIKDVPFDLRSYRIINYTTSLDEDEKLKKNLMAIALKLKEGALSFGNPVSDFAPSKRSAPREMISIPSEEKEEEKEEYGVLDFSVGANQAMEGITGFLNLITEKSTNLSNKMKARTAEVNALSGRGTPETTSRVHKIAKAMGSDMVQYSNEIELEFPKMNDVWERFVENTTNLFAAVQIETAEDREALLQAKRTTEEARDAFGFALGSTNSAKEAISGLKGISRDLSLGVRRTSQTLDAIIDFFSVGESYIMRIINLIDERLGEETKR